MKQRYGEKRFVPLSIFPFGLAKKLFVAFVLVGVIRRLFSFQVLQLRTRIV